MRKIIQTLLIVLSLAYLTSCSVYEELTFHKNGQIAYNMTIDGKELMQMFPNEKFSSSNISDTVMSIGQMIENEKMDVINEYPGLKEDIENMKSIFLKIAGNDEKREFYLSIFGDFKDVRTFNKAFGSVANYVSKAKEDASVNISGSNLGKGDQLMLWLASFPVYQWDGKNMKRTVETSMLPKSDSDINDGSTPNQDPFANIDTFFESTKLTIKYHFPKKVESVNNTDALLSQDGKTVIIEYPASVFTSSPKDADIEIKLKK